MQHGEYSWEFLHCKVSFVADSESDNMPTNCPQPVHWPSEVHHIQNLLDCCLTATQLPSKLNVYKELAEGSHICERAFICTFIYRGAGHVIETQCSVNIIDVLQEGEEVLHFFKRDALCEREKENAKMIHIYLV